MANTSLSSIGGVIQGNWTDEEIVVCLGDNAVTPGMLVGVVVGSGVVQPVHPDTNNEDEFLGIALPALNTDMDTAPGTGVPMNIVIPQSGHLYGILTKALPASTLVGEPLQIDEDVDGQMEVGGNIEEEHIARLFKGDESDTYIIVNWGS